MLMVVPTLMSGIWELRAFCRYVCPVSVFVGPFSRMSTLALRNKSQDVCDQCKPHYCENGNTNGWACPYGLNVGEIKENSDCGLCLECLRSCTYNNVSLYRRPFASEKGTRNLSEAWMTMAIFTIAIIYSIFYLGPWPVVRDYVNILDKENWGLFGIYSLIMWTSVLIIVPGIVYLLSRAGLSILQKSDAAPKEVFLEYAGSLLPFGTAELDSFCNSNAFCKCHLYCSILVRSVWLGMGFLWNRKYSMASVSTSVHSMVSGCSRAYGLVLSLRNIRKSRYLRDLNPQQVFKICLPVSLFLTAVAVAMLFFFTN